MKEKISYLFLQLDIFGTYPRFKINGEKKFNTYFGCIMTIICISIISLFFYIYVINALNHSKPKLLTTIYNDALTEKKIITSKDFSIAISLQHQNYSNFINEKIYTIKAGLYTAISDSQKKQNKIIKEIELMKCNENHFDIIPEYFSNLDLENLYCLKNGTFEIEGEYASNVFSYLYFNFQMCKNSSDNGNFCESRENIEKILNGGYVGMFISDKSVIPNNFSIPYQIYGKNLFTAFSYKYYTDFWIYFKTVEVYTDEGYFFIKTKKESFIAFDKVENNFDFRQNENFALVGLRQSFKKEIYERSYTKFQEAAATAGGIVKITTLFGEFVVYFFRQILYKNFINQFFKFNKKHINKTHELSSFQISNKLFLSPAKSAKRNLHLNTNKKRLNNINIDATPKFQINNDNYSNSSKNNNSNLRSNFNQIPNFSSLCKSSLPFKEPSKETDISIISALHNFDKNNIHNSNKKIIRVDNSRNCLKLLLRKKCLKKIKLIHLNFDKIDFLFDIVEYFKTIFEVKLMKNKIFDKEQRNKLTHIFKFDYDFDIEKEGYDIFYKKKRPDRNYSNSIPVRKSISLIKKKYEM